MDDAVAGPAEDQLVGDDSERIDIGGEGDFSRMFEQLRTHISRGSDEAPLARDFPLELGDSEIDHLNIARFRDQDVFRFEIAVDDAVGVEVAESIGDLQDDFQGPFLRERFLPDELPERDAADELHRDVETLFPLPLAVELHDIGMARHADDLGLLEKAADGFLIFDIFGNQDLDGDRLARRRVDSQVEEAHAPFAQETLYFIGADFERKGIGAFPRMQVRKRRLIVEIPVHRSPENRAGRSLSYFEDADAEGLSQMDQLGAPHFLTADREGDPLIRMDGEF